MNFLSRHVIGVLIVLIVAGWALFYVPTTPSYAIYQLKQSIDARDGATAATFVDFPAVVKNAGHEMMQQSNSNDVMTSVLGGAMELLSGPVAAAIQQWATQQVDDGARQVQMPAAAVAGAIVTLHRSGDSAWTDFHDNQGREWNIRFQRENGRWRVVQVKDIQQLLQRFQQQRGMGIAPAPGAAVPGLPAPGGTMPPGTAPPNGASTSP
ncbi:MAG TPA: DUF2939 domain-containing protein [Candidatus Binataceae bacterium]|nr:DUF2939 domain-containing protein [Candidatus Binataceae bacterium]